MFYRCISGNLVAPNLLSMKSGLIILLLFVSATSFAQRITGVVIDRLTRLPVYNAKIETPRAVAYANSNGIFNLSPVKTGDSCTVSYEGYKLSRMAIKSVTDTLKIYLDKPSILLSGVNVLGKRDYKTDSVRNRQMFANIYNYRGGGLKEVLIEKASMEYKPNNYIDGPATTTNIGGFNVLQFVNLFSKNKSQTSKLQKTLITDEDESYVDRYFTKRKVITLTSMKGDSLQNFMVRYRPTVYQIKTMSDYELAMYIKASYAEFKRQIK